jgi:hypothetical protein
MTNHPITPTLKLFRKWTEYRGTECEDQFWWRIATQAARWGADQELEACCEWVDSFQDKFVHAHDLRLVRRPKSPSLKEQAQAELDRLIALIPTEGAIAMAEPIRRALEALPE